MQRVVVLGCAGSGKTTFARLLGPVIGAEVVHLDRLFWKPRWVESSPDELRAAQEPYLALDRWVIDGNYSSSHEERLEQADTIVLLDLPRPLCLWRVLVRTALNRGRTRADIAEGCPDQFDLAFLRWIWTWPRRSLPRWLERIERHREGRLIVILRSRAEIRAFLEAAGRQRSLARHA